MTTDEHQARVAHCAATYDSPCVGLCNDLYLVKDTDRCRGCGRTKTAKDAWILLDAQERKEHWGQVISLGWKPNRGIT